MIEGKGKEGFGIGIDLDRMIGMAVWACEISYVNKFSSLRRKVA